MSTLGLIARLALRLVRVVRAIVIGRVRFSDEPIHRDEPARIIRLAVVRAPARNALPESMWEPSSREPYRASTATAESEAQAARESVIELLRAAGYDDGGHRGYTLTAFRTLTRNAYREHTELAYYRAEEACRGHMLSRAGRRAGTNPRDLFEGPWHIARTHGSEELVTWWEHGESRLTYARYCDDLLRAGLEEYQAREVA